MELTRHRRQPGKLWSIDKAGRWRSREWRTWVRTLGYRAHLPRPEFGDTVIAAHFRYPGCGAGVKPADCFVYPMLDSEHKRAHNRGQDDLEKQWQYAVWTMVQGVVTRKVLANESAKDWLTVLYRESIGCRADLSTPAIERIAWEWAQRWKDDEVWFNEQKIGDFPG